MLIVEQKHTDSF